MIFIRTDSAIDTLERLKVALSTGQLAIVESRAINKTLLKARTQARKEVKRVYNISQKDLAGIDIQRSNPATVTGNLVASRKPIPLSAFNPKQETGSGSVQITKRGTHKQTVLKRANDNPAAGISIEIFKGKRVQVPFAFLIAGGAAQVFARGAYKTGTQYGFVQRHTRVNASGSNDNPIKPLITISAYGEILNDTVMGRIADGVQRDYPEQLENQILFALQTT